MIIIAVGSIDAPPANAQVSPPTPLDLSKLDPNPIRQWGVVGSGTSLTTPKPFVWDFAEIGSRIYVAGTFTGVQRYAFDPASTVIAQSYLAAFDRDTGDWISTFRPTLNRTAYTLAVAPNGNLLVGGEFDTVNGETRKGLAMLDPATGATVPSFGATVSRISGQAIVRKLLRKDGDLYVAGEFSHYVRAGISYWVANAVRLRADSGDLDPAWLPGFAGSVWDLAVDSGRGRVQAVGFFTSVNAWPNTNRFATVTEDTGATVTGLPQYEFNTSGQIDTVTVAVAGDHTWVGGAEHIATMLDPVTNARLAYSTTGISCDTFLMGAGCTFTAGGDFQKFRAVGNLILAGCHCFRPSEQQGAGNTTWNGRSHYNSVSNQRTDNRVMIAYDATTGAVASNFVPGLKVATYGTWALFADSRGCLYAGGGFSRSESGDWIGGFGRFCQPVAPVTGLAAESTNRQVRLSWPAPTTQLPIARYKVFRDGVFIGDTTNPAFTDGGATAGAVATYILRTQDVTNRLSATSEVTIQVAPTDTTNPGPPGSPSGSVNGSDVSLAWTAATDDQGVREYLIHRDFQYVTSVPANALAYVDSGVINGPHRYDIRASDWAGNFSTPATVNVSVGPADTQAPTVPANLAGPAAGSTVNLSWSASTDLPSVGGSGLNGYLIHRDFQFVAFVGAATTIYNDSGVANGPHRYEVRAQDRAGNNSTPATITVSVGPPDTQAPTTPTNVTASLSPVAVNLSWSPSTDLPDPGGSGLAGYLVHRDFQFLAFVPAGTSYSDTTAAVGTHRYEIRAQDKAGNNSAPSAPLNVTVN